MTDGSGRELRVRAVPGLPEVRPGDDLSDLVAQGVPDLSDGDVVVVTSKVVSKAEGRIEDGDRDQAVASQTVRVLARRGDTRIVTTPQGLVLAAAGVDASNTPAGTVALLPVNPDGSARRLRRDLATRTGRRVGVLVTDTAGRPWRIGQTDIAIGCAGLAPVHSYAGQVDPFGNELVATAPAVADEVAAAADLVKAKLTGCPVAVVTGLGHLVLPAGDDGPGAVALQRPADEDMFGLGSREAVRAAVRGDDAVALAAFGAGEPLNPVLADVNAGPDAQAMRCRPVPLTDGRGPGEVGVAVLVADSVPAEAARMWAGVAVGRLTVRAAAAGWERVDEPDPAPGSFPEPRGVAEPGWRTVLVVGLRRRGRPG